MRPRSLAGRGRPLLVFLLALTALSAAALVLSSAAWADAVSPEAGPTPNAVDTDNLYKVVLITGLAVIALVWGVLFFSLFRWRARRGDRPPQIRGNTPLELGWTIGASTLALAVGIVALFFLDDIRDPAPSGVPALAEARQQNAAVDQPAPPGGDALAIKVSGQQYLWRYQYPNGAVSFHDMVVPKDTTVTLEIESNDVAHSWWIPALGGKQDALRGLTNETWFKAGKTGVFRGQCGEYCGTNHSAMTAKVIVVEPARFQQWVERQKRLVEQAQQAVQGQRERILGQDEAGAGE